ISKSFLVKYDVTIFIKYMLTIINKIAPIIVKITTVVDKSTLGLTKNCTPDRLVISPNKNKPNKAK
ncbi:hypothetical protein BJI72_1384, partial [Staphylococcus aureus]